MSTVSCGQYPLVRYQCSSTEPLAIHKKSSHPWIRMRRGLFTTDNSLSSCNSTFI